MPRLKAANNAESTLNISITSTDATFTVVDASMFPAAPFRVTVDTEIMEVGAIDKPTNTFSSVTRGLEGTLATSHASGARVENRLTAGYLSELADANHTHPDYASSATRQDETTALVVEVRTTDPTTPEVGRIWLRSDL
jgi:hypothetical protein